MHNIKGLNLELNTVWEITKHCPKVFLTTNISYLCNIRKLYTIMKTPNQRYTFSMSCTDTRKNQDKAPSQHHLLKTAELLEPKSPQICNAFFLISFAFEISKARDCSYSKVS